MNPELQVEIFVRLSTIEKCLFDANLVNKEEYYKKMNEITKDLTDKFVNKDKKE